MPCPAWDEDKPTDLPRIVTNIKDLWPSIEADAVTRPAPSVAMAFDWHRRTYAGIAVPEPDYIGNVRDSDQRYPCLIDYEVAVGTAQAVRARDVPMALDAFVQSTSMVTGRLDAAVPVRRRPTAPGALAAVIRLCAYAHGEWIRIHPFANGNGRTARIWANWLAVRYGLPPFVRLMPRPDDVLFAGAAEMSMRGDHRATEAMFAVMMRDAVSPRLRPRP